MTIKDWFNSLNPFYQRRRKDEAYLERNFLAAALAREYPSGVRETKIPFWNPEWNGCVYIDLPTGQISYHYHIKQAWLFKDLPTYKKEYDGHDKGEVHRRLRNLISLSVCREN